MAVNCDQTDVVYANRYYLDATTRDPVTRETIMYHSFIDWGTAKVGNDGDFFMEGPPSQLFDSSVVLSFVNGAILYQDNRWDIYQQTDKLVDIPGALAAQTPWASEFHFKWPGI